MSATRPRQDIHGKDWNVLTSSWLEIMNTDAEVKTISPLEALMQTTSINRLALSSPLDQFAALRFLLTLLYWKADRVGGVQNLRTSLLEKEMPGEILNALKDETQHFSLFDKDRPFLQDISLNLPPKDKDKKSAAYLFPELATGTNIAHFHHGDNANLHLCLRCATLGMLNVVPWTQSGGAGLTPSVDGAPPIRVIAFGQNLATTLGLNLVPIEGPAGEPKWTGCFNPTDKNASIPYLEAFTWNPRRIRLFLEDIQVCWRCGDSGNPTIGKIVYSKNENTKQSDKKPFEWQDPAAFYGGGKEPFKTIKSSNEEGVACDKDISGLLNKDNPTSYIIETNPDWRNWQLIIPCTRGDMKTFDHRQLFLEGPFLDSVRSRIQSKEEQKQDRKEIDGWAEPRDTNPPKRDKKFIHLANKLFSHSDWAMFSSASFRDMQSAPAAFDIFSALFWTLPNKERPSKNVYWLVLKLMAKVPAQYRNLSDTGFNPVTHIPKRQWVGKRSQDKTNQAIIYPIAFPCGNQLEAELHKIINKNMRKQNPEKINWAGLCHCLEQLINRNHLK